MNNPKVVSIPTADGGSYDYVLYKDRLKEFLAEYPPKEGWKRIAVPLDPVALVPWLAEKYAKYLAACMDKGKEPLKLAAFQAQLLNPTNEVVVQVHYIGLVINWDDVMRVETRAFDRLLIHTGHGSDPTEEAVQADPALGQVIAPSAQVLDDDLAGVQIIGLTPVVKAELPTQDEHEDPAPPVPVPAEAEPPEAPTLAVDTPAPAGTPAEDDIPPLKNNIPDALLLQLRVMTEAKGNVFVPPTTLGEARCMQRQLLSRPH